MLLLNGRLATTPRLTVPERARAFLRLVSEKPRFIMYMSKAGSSSKHRFGGHPSHHVDELLFTQTNATVPSEAAYKHVEGIYQKCQGWLSNVYLRPTLEMWCSTAMQRTASQVLSRMGRVKPSAIATSARREADVENSFSRGGSKRCAAT